MSDHQTFTHIGHRWSLLVEARNLTGSGAEPRVLATIPGRRLGWNLSVFYAERGQIPVMSGIQAAQPEEVDREN